MKSIIGNSYNKLYCQFTAEELTEVGNYRIIKQIGEGSFGKVYLASHRLTHRKVVLKTSDKNDPNVVREVFYHRQFDYLYITRLYEVIVTETKVWMALEYCPGKELYEHLLALKRIPLDECTRLFAQIVSAIYYAHSLNCVHRDLKLENILLDKAGNAKLTDFGFTRECVSKSQLDTICGTTVYMAPELTERRSYDGFKIDIWALGVILYTMINGSMPFDEDDEVKTKWKIVHEMPTINEDLVSPDAKDLIEQLLAKDPNDRPSIEKILAHPFLQPYGIPLMEKTEKTLRRQRRGSVYFHSKLERKLLKRLKQMGFDTQAIKTSILKKKCDALSGLWLLLVEREMSLEKHDLPRRSRSVLSVRKVFDNSLGSVETRGGHDKSACQPSESRRTTPLNRILSRNHESSSYTSPSPRKTSWEPLIMNSVMDYNSNQPTNGNSTGTSTPRKQNIFSKVSKFFKQKRMNSVAASITNRKSQESAKSRNTSSSESLKEIENQDKKRANRSESLRSTSKDISGSSNDQDATKSTRDQAYSTASVATQLKPERQPRQLKRLKSTTSSDVSGQTSELASNNNRSSFTENNNAQNFRTARPISVVSQHSELSNDTFNSEYSTDYNASSFKASDSAKSSFPHATATGVSQYSTGSEKTNLGYSQKFAVRDLSIMSSASSASERSSRTDSFYDITTASSPMMDVRNISRAPVKDSILPRFGAQSHRLAKRNHVGSRRFNTGRRTHGKDLLKNSQGPTQSIIQEESSSGGDEEKLTTVKISLPEKPEAGEEDELEIHSDTEAPGAVTGPAKLRYDDNPAAFSFSRSLSEGSEWSRSFLELRHDRKTKSRALEDEEALILTDNEDPSYG